MSKLKDIEQIHESMINGQGKQAVEQMTEYGDYDFAKDYMNYLQDICISGRDAWRYFTDAIITRDRIRNR